MKNKAFEIYSILVFLQCANKDSSIMSFSVPLGRLSSAMCRLCHGKFSSRSLRHAFNSWPQDSVDFVKSPVLFHADFQQLVGVQLDQDPRLSNFICKTCHTKFYKCHNILLRFLQRVNRLPLGQQNSKHQ